MESLERLRRYVNEHTNKDWEYSTFPPQRQLVNCTDTAVFGLIDAIEQEHAELLDKALGEQDDAIRHAREVAYSTGYEAGFDEGLASTDGWSADDWTGQHEDAMAERGWVKLPVDADGEVVRIGDELCDRWLEQNQGEVERLMLDHHGWWLMLKSCPEQFYVHDFHEWHHRHHEPTVEDVLEELLREYDRDDSELTNGEIIERFAAKLRLEGDE